MRIRLPSVGLKIRRDKTAARAQAEADLAGKYEFGFRYKTSDNVTHIASRLKQLDTLKSQDLITEAEYAEKRTAILAEL